LVRLTQDGREIKLAPLAIYATLKEVHELRRFQLIALPENLSNCESSLRKAFPAKRRSRAQKKALESFFALHGAAQVSIALSGDEPRQDAGSGKFKHIICRT
jgi:hypothetical protein